jgi:hypothetical protein
VAALSAGRQHREIGLAKAISCSMSWDRCARRALIDRLDALADDRGAQRLVEPSRRPAAPNARSATANVLSMRSGTVSRHAATWTAAIAAASPACVLRIVISSTAAKPSQAPDPTSHLGRHA